MIGLVHKRKPAKDRIVEALTELMEEKNLSDISVIDISQQAGVSRMTFYRHFRQKEDVLDCVFREASQSIIQYVTALERKRGLSVYYEAIFEYLKRYSRVVLSAYNSHYGEMILCRVNDSLMTGFSDNTTALDGYRHRFFAGAFFNVYICWVKDGMKESSKKMAELFCSLVRDKALV